jgi:iron complex outermembrane recepter protein
MIEKLRSCPLAGNTVFAVLPDGPLGKQMTTRYRSALLSATVLVAASAVCSAALAQTAPATQPKPPEEAVAPATVAPAAAAAPRSAETVVVTGSRIARSTFTSTAPITVITSESSSLAGQNNITEIIQNSPAASGSSQVNNSYTGFITEGGPGVNTIGLRGLGPGRTLVLLNGKRLPPAGTQGQVNAVDLNVIPSLAVDRTEVLRDGASAIYGSDAIGGVVNMVTRKNVNGLELSFSGVADPQGGGENFLVGALWGKTQDTWNFMVSAEYFELKELNVGDRDFAACTEDYVFDPATGARADFIDPKTGKFLCRGGLVVNAIQAQNGTLWGPDATATGPLIGRRPDATSIPGSSTLCTNAFGNVVTCNAALTVAGFRRLFWPRQGTTGIDPTIELERQQPSQLEEDIYSPVKRATIYATGAVDLPFLAGAEAFGELLVNRRESTQNGTANTTAFLTAAYPGNPFAAIGLGANLFIAVPYEFDQTVQTTQGIVGVRGSTGNGFGGFMRSGRWEMSLQSSVAEGEYLTQDVLDDRVLASANQTIVNGVRTCPSPAITGGPCLAIDFFSPAFLAGNYTDAEKNYLFTKQLGKTTYKQTIFEGTVSGDMFKLPAGNVAASFGVQYRDYSINDVPSAESRGGNTRIFSTAGITKGEDSVLELFTEIEVPLLKGKPLAEDLSLNLQGRYTDYDSYGESPTYKVSLNWQITPEVRARGGVGTSYRAPALFELYLSDSEYFLNPINDPCINWNDSNNAQVRSLCSAEGVPSGYLGRSSSITAVERGGKGFVEAETADTSTFGIVWRPKFADLQVALDYSSVEVNNQIAQYGARNILGLCYRGEAEFRYLCGQIKRDPVTKDITQVLDPYLNVSSIAQEELSLNIDYSLDLAFGTFSIASETTFQTRGDSKLLSTSDPSKFLGDIGFPEVVNRTQFQFKRKDWTYTWTARYVGPSSDLEDFLERYDENPTDAGGIYGFNGVPKALYKVETEAMVYHAVTVRYRSDNWTAVVGVTNLFDETPPAISTAPNGFTPTTPRLGNAPLTSQYDLNGRSVYLEVRRRF